jgi:hypothetical protein
VARVLSRIGARIWNGAPPQFATMALPELRIESSRRVVEVSIDGDVWSMRPPLHCRLRERPIRVLTPCDSAALPPLPSSRSVVAEPTATAPSAPSGLELELEPPDTTLQP